MMEKSRIERESCQGRALPAATRYRFLKSGIVWRIWRTIGEPGELLRDENTTY